MKHFIFKFITDHGALLMCVITTLGLSILQYIESEGWARQKIKLTSSQSTPAVGFDNEVYNEETTASPASISKKQHGDKFLHQILNGLGNEIGRMAVNYQITKNIDEDR